MRHFLLLMTIILMSSLAVSADDQQKAEKEIRKINAMAWDSTGRVVVNQSISETFKVPRSQLVEERQQLQLSYGSLFVVHELGLGGPTMKNIGASLKGGKNIIQIANESSANWKQIAADAKKLNSKIEDNLYKHFLTSQSRDQAEYNAARDGVKADDDVSKQDLAEAQQTFIRWRERASQIGKNSHQTDLEDEQAVRKDRPDPVRTMPQPGMGGTVPK